MIYTQSTHSISSTTPNDYTVQDSCTKFSFQITWRVFPPQWRNNFLTGSLIGGERILKHVPSIATDGKGERAPFRNTCKNSYFESGAPAWIQNSKTITTNQWVQWPGGWIQLKKQLQIDPLGDKKRKIQAEKSRTRSQSWFKTTCIVFYNNIAAGRYSNNTRCFKSALQ